MRVAASKKRSRNTARLRPLDSTGEVSAPLRTGLAANSTIQRHRYCRSDHPASAVYDDFIDDLGVARHSPAAHLLRPSARPLASAQNAPPPGPVFLPHHLQHLPSELLLVSMIRSLSCAAMLQARRAFLAIALPQRLGLPVAPRSSLLASTTRNWLLRTRASTSTLRKSS